MLSLYGSFKVPGVNHVTLYRDDENPHKFYMVPERPTIARDDEGNPLFTFILYARDVDRLAPDEREVQRAYLSLSTQVAVSPEDEQKIRTYLRQMLSGEKNRGYRFLKLPILRVEPELSYPPVFTQGSVEFKTFDEELAPFSVGSKAPSLVGANLASFSQMLSQDGSELFRQSVVRGIVPSVIHYSLAFLAKIPAVSIRIYGDRRDFYEELKRHTYVTQIQTRNGRVVSMRTWPEIGSLKEFRRLFHSLKIEIDDGDFRDADPSDDVTAKLEELAFRIIENNILPHFFETAFEPATDEQSSNKWLKELEKEMTGQIDVRINRSDVVEQWVHPNSQLGEVLTPDEIRRQTVYVDLGDPFFSELDVTVNANVNFADDPVYALKVFLDYDQQDEIRGVRVKRAKEFLFRSPDQVARFRQVMAKDASGTPKDEYRYWSEIVYKGTGETIRVPRTGSLTSRERQLVISYRRLGFVKVTLILGAMPDNVRSARVDVRYPRSSLPSAVQSFELTRENPTATYFTYTGHDGEPGPYHYKITYNLTDGQKMELPEAQGQAERLVITDPFEHSVSTRFVAQADFQQVSKIIVDARYRDSANDFASEHHAEFMANGETSLWTVPLRDPGHRSFTYDVIIINRNGTRQEIRSREQELGATVAVPAAAADVLEVTIVPALVDWSRYQLVLLYLEYTDPDNGVHETKNFTFRPANGDMDQTWKVLLRDPGKTEFRYRLRFFGFNSADNRDVPWVTTSDPILVIENPPMENPA